MDTNRIIEALDRTGDAVIAVFGDYALDKYLYTDPADNEPSVETGIDAFQFFSRQLSAGVGGTVTQNLLALGANVICIGIVGDDGEGYELLKVLEEKGADISLMVKEPKLHTCTYVKPMQKQQDGTYVELNRMDFRNRIEPPVHVQKKMLENLEKALERAQAVIVVDQYFQRNMGAVTDYIRTELGNLALKYPDRLFYADSRSFINEYNNMTLKCNNMELFNKFENGIGDPESIEEIKAAGNKIKEKTGHKFFVTCGSRGIMIFDDGKAELIPAFKVEGPIDIVGAGDATSASLVLGMVLGLTSQEAAKLACAVSSITIQQIGTTGTACPEEVIKVLKN